MERRLGTINYFDPAGKCYSCAEAYCNTTGFASYDADGDLMKLVTHSGVDSHIISYWYKKADTEDTPATEPFHIQASPCCYTAILDGFQNNDVSKSWCSSCEDLNGVYHDTSKGLFTITQLGPDFIESSGVRAWTPCTMNRMYFYIALESTDVPGSADIVAHFDIYACDYTGNCTNNLLQVVGWKKILAPYYGDLFNEEYNPVTNTYSPYLHYLERNYGVFDGRDISVDFTSENLVVEDNLLPNLPYVSDSRKVYNISNLCNFNTGNIHIESRIDHNTSRVCQDKSYALISQYCSPIQIDIPSCKSMTYNLVQTQELPYISSKTLLNLVGISGVDNLLSLEEMQAYNCQKCNNLNRDYNLIYDSLYERWSFTSSQSDDNIDLCCDCGVSNETVSTCISDIRGYFYQWQYDIRFPYYNLDFIVDIIGNYGTVIAKYGTRLIESNTNVLNSLNCNNLSLELPLLESMEPSGWQRCDFTNSIAHVTFDSYDDTTIYSSYFFAGKTRCDGDGLFKVSVPDDSFVWRGNYICYDSIYSYFTVDCSGVQPAHGDYYLEVCNPNYTESLGGLHKQNCSCPGCTNMSMNLSFELITTEAIPYYKVKLTIQIDESCCDFDFVGQIPAYPTDFNDNLFILNSINRERESYYGYYYNCSDINGLNLIYQEPSNRNCSQPPYYPYSLWTYIGGNITLEYITS